MGILGAKIVARRRVGTAPPGGGDAFGALDRGDVVQDAPPAEAQRRPVGHFGDRLDRLGTDEEPQRPRRRVGVVVIARSGATKQSKSWERWLLDCFASLAMTASLPAH